MQDTAAGSKIHKTLYFPGSRDPFGLKDWWRNFIEFSLYRKFSYMSLCNKELNIQKSYKTPTECFNLKEFWRISNMGSNFSYMSLCNKELNISYVMLQSKRILDDI
jgi:hypothetical protein